MSTASRSEPRDGYRVRVLAVHTTEGGGTAKQLRDAAWWEGSSHAIADNIPEAQGGGLLTPADGCVPYDRASWTLRSGNRWSDNLELVAMASWSRAKWLTQTLLLNRCARWLADRHNAQPWIPLTKITAAQYRAGGSGVIGHVDHTAAYGGPSGDGGAHWDPGPNFPWDVVIAKARVYAQGTPEPTPAEEEDDDMVRLMNSDEGDDVLCVDHGQRTFWRVMNPAQEAWLRAQGIKKLSGRQPFAKLAGYREIQPAEPAA